MLRDFIEEVTALTILLLILLAIGLGLSWGTNAIDANSLRKLGYEAKVVNFVCYAKHQGRWMSCTTVTNNAVEINKPKE